MISNSYVAENLIFGLKHDIDFTLRMWNSFVFCSAQICLEIVTRLQ